MFTPKKIYLASSWRNDLQPMVLDALRQAGHHVYDPREPVSGIRGFRWTDLPGRRWDALSARQGLYHPDADRAFHQDFAALSWCDTAVLLIPAGANAHLTAAFLAAQGKPVYALQYGVCEPQLLYRLFRPVCTSIGELLNLLGHGGEPQMQCPEIPRLQVA